MVGFEPRTRAANWVGVERVCANGTTVILQSKARRSSAIRLEASMGSLIERCKRMEQVLRSTQPTQQRWFSDDRPSKGVCCVILCARNKRK